MLEKPPINIIKYFVVSPVTFCKGLFNRIYKNFRNILQCANWDKNKGQSTIFKCQILLIGLCYKIYKEVYSITFLYDKYQSYYYLNERQYYHRLGKTSKRKPIRDEQKINYLIHLRENTDLCCSPSR